MAAGNGHVGILSRNGCVQHERAVQRSPAIADRLNGVPRESWSKEPVRVLLWVSGRRRLGTEADC